MATVSTGKIHQLTVYDSRAYGNIDIHPIEKDSSLLKSLRAFGKSEEFFASKRKVVVPVVGPSSFAGVAVEKVDESAELPF